MVRELTRRNLHWQVRMHLAVMQFHSDLLNEPSHLAVGPAQHLRQQSRAETFKRTGEVLQPVGLAWLLGSLGLQRAL